MLQTKTVEVELICMGKLGTTPKTYALKRPGVGPGRMEALGFKSKAEAKLFAASHSLSIVKENKNAQ